MPQFAFTCLDQDKKSVTGTIRASDYNTALKALAGQYNVVVQVREIKKRARLFTRKVTGEEIMVFTQQIATMLKAGLPLKRTLDIMMEDADNPTMRNVLSEISSGINRGKALSEMFALYPDIFSKLYLYMVEAGEVGGKLPEILKKLADYIEISENLKKKVKAALYYPAAVMIIAILLSLFIFVFGVKQFEQIYAGLNVTLPRGTLMFIALVNFLSTYWLLILFACCVIFYLGGMYLKTSRGAFLFDRFTLHLPVMGPLLQRLAIARFSRTLSSLYSGGVPILKSLELVAGSMGNRVMERAVQNLLENIKEGESLASSLRASKVFTSMALSMISTGEESGTLDTMLNELALFYEVQVEIMLKGMASLIEPIIIVFVGIFVGILLVVLGMPLFNLVQVLM